MTVNLPDDGESEFVCMPREEYLKEKDKSFNAGGYVMLAIAILVFWLAGFLG